MAVTGVGNGPAIETGPGASVDQVVAAAAVELVVPNNAPEMQF
jgi:hypothetical protein